MLSKTIFERWFLRNQICFKKQIDNVPGSALLLLPGHSGARLNVRHVILQRDNRMLGCLIDMLFLSGCFNV